MKDIILKGIMYAIEYAVFMLKLLLFIGLLFVIYVWTAYDFFYGDKCGVSTFVIFMIYPATIIMIIYSIYEYLCQKYNHKSIFCCEDNDCNRYDPDAMP